MKYLTVEEYAYKIGRQPVTVRWQLLNGKIKDFKKVYHPYCPAGFKYMIKDFK